MPVANRVHWRTCCCHRLSLRISWRSRRFNWSMCIYDPMLCRTLGSELPHRQLQSVYDCGNSSQPLCTPTSPVDLSRVASTCSGWHYRQELLSYCSDWHWTVMPLSRPRSQIPPQGPIGRSTCCLFKPLRVVSLRCQHLLVGFVAIASKAHQICAGCLLFLLLCWRFGRWALHFHRWCRFRWFGPSFWNTWPWRLGPVIVIGCSLASINVSKACTIA